MEHIQLTATDTPRPRAAEEGDEADCPRSFLAAMIATAIRGGTAGDVRNVLREETVDFRFDFFIVLYCPQSRSMNTSSS